MEEEDQFGVVEWVIENFACYNREIHGEYIESPLFDHNSRFRLTPQGPRGHMEVQIAKVSGGRKTRSNLGVLTFVGSYGFTLHTQDMGVVMEDQDSSDPPLTFEGVRDLTRERAHPDQFTLRYKFASKRSFRENMCTLLEVVEASLDLTDLDVVMATGQHGSDRIADIDFGQGKLPSRMHLTLFRTGNDVELMLEPSNFKKYCLVQCRINMNDEGFELKEHLFFDENPWVVAESKNLDENKSISVLLRLKIVTGTISKKYFRRLNNYSDARDTSAFSQNSFSELDISAADTCLMAEKETHDVFLRCGSVTFASNKNVLSAWSPVFERLLTTDMSESVSGRVDIADLDPPTLARFLSFLHTATADDLNSFDSASKLYYAADKYDIPTLKRECRDHLARNLAVSNVCDTLLLGTKHSDEELVEAAQDFILNNFNSVLASKEWKEFKSAEPLLAVNTITGFAEKNCLGRINA